MARHRGIAMLLVLIAVAMATILSMSFLSSQATSVGVAQNVQGHAQARSVAESALVTAINYVQTDADWRTDKSEGQWVSSASFNGGTFDLYAYDGLDTDGDGVVDDTDGDLSDDASDPVTLKVVADVDGVSHTVFAVVTTGGTNLGTLLLVTNDASSPHSNDVQKAGIIEGFGWTVEFISDHDNQSTYDAEMADADVVFISEDANTFTIDDKLDNAPIGVVSEEDEHDDNLGLTSGDGDHYTDNDIDIVDNSHYITEVFSTGDLDLAPSNTYLHYNSSTVASGADVLAERKSSSSAVLIALDAGATNASGSPSTSRRVRLPFGGYDTFDIDNVNDDALTILERSLKWASEGSTYSGVTYQGFEEGKRSSNSSSLTVSTPSGTAEGDLLIAALATDGNESMAMSGWTQIAMNNQGGTTLGVWWKLAGASESSSHTFTWGSNEEAYGWIMRFTGHHPTTPIDASATGGGTSSSPTSPSVTTTVDNAMVLRIGGFDDDDISTDSPGLTGHATITMDESGSGSGTSSGGAGYVIQASAGASGTSNFSLTNNEQYRAVTVAIAPDDSGGGSGGSASEPNLIALYEFQEVASPEPALVGHWQLDDAAAGGGGGAVAADGKITLKSDAVIDSYDSSAGAYGGGNSGSNAVVSTNSTSGGDVDTSGGSQVKGDLYVGVGGNPSSVISGSVSVTGTEAALTTAVDMPNWGSPSGMPSSQGDKSINGTKSWTSDQTFDDLTFNSSAKLTVTGNITVWVKKSVEFKEESDLMISPGSSLTMYVKEDVQIKSEAQINADSSQAADFTLIQYQSGKTVSISEEAVFAGTIDSESKIEVKSEAVLYGSFRAGDEFIIEEEAKVHLDVSLAGFMGGGGGSVTAVDEVAANDGSSSGTVTAESAGNGDGGTSVDFDGTDGYIEVAHDNAYLLNNGVVSFWFNADALTGHQGLVSKDSNNFDTGGHLHVYADGGTLTARIQDAGGSSYTLTSSGLSTGTWYHVVVSWGAGGFNLYRNGSLVDSDPYNGGIGTNSGGSGNYETMVFGASTWTSDDLIATPITYYFDGRIDDVRIYDGGFNTTQANNVYGGSTPGTGDANTVFDTSGYGTALDLDIEDTANVSWGGGLTIDSATRIISPSAATKIYDALTATNQMSIEVQFTPTNISQSGPARIVSFAGGSSDTNFTIGQDSSAHVTRLHTTSTTSNGTPEADTGSVLSAGVQEHAIISYDGTEITVYRDGASAVTLSRTGDFDWDNSFNFMLGNEAIDGYDWLGTLHRVAIYDEAFNQTQADNVFGGGDPGDGETGSGGAVNSVDWVEQ